MSNENTFLNNKIRNLLFGGLAGAASRTVVAPIERIKTINQVRPETASRSIYSNVRYIFRNEGIRWLYSGNLINCIRIVPKSGIQYMSYKWATKYTDSNFIAGAFSGLVTASSTYPLELIRTNLSLQENNAKYSGIIDCTKQIYRKSGVSGFYRGITPCLLGVIPFYAINFGIFKFAQSELGGSSVGNDFIAGSISMFTALSVAFPSDLIKKKMQMRDQYNIPNYPNFIECSKDTLNKQGIRADYTKMLPANGMYFVIIGLLNRYFII